MIPVGVAQDISMRFLVDDSSTMRRIIINTLNKRGHQEELFVELIVTRSAGQ